MYKYKKPLIAKHAASFTLVKYFKTSGFCLFQLTTVTMGPSSA